MSTNNLLSMLAVAALGSALSLLIIYFYFIKSDLKGLMASQPKTVAKDSNPDALLPIRLQAHERLVIFVERINPANLLVRLHHSGIEIAALQTLAINEINSEYQHNITQQLYVGAITWNVIRKLKDDTVAMINNAARNLPIDASGLELSKKVLQHMSQIEENPYELTINLIKKDIHQMF